MRWSLGTQEGHLAELSAERLSLGVSRVTPERYVVRVIGELDLHSAPQLREALVDLLAAGAERIALDCSELTFIDSAGIGVVAGGEKRARFQACEFVVCRPTIAVMRALEQTGLARHLTFA